MKIKRDCLIEKAASDDKTRPVLGHCYLDAEKQRLIATNGRIMAVIPAAVESSDVSGYVTAQALKAWRKESRRSYVPLEANGSLKVGGTAFERPTQENVGTFPNVDLLIDNAKKAPKVLTVTLNAALLHDLAEALGNDVVTLEFQNALGTVRVSTANGHGLIMPVKG